MIDRRVRDRWTYAVLAIVGAGLVMKVAKLLMGDSVQAVIGTWRVLIPTGAALIALAWAFWMAVEALKRVDEFQIAAGKFAWYWGGSIGIGVSAVSFTFVRFGGLQWLAPDRFHLTPDFLDPLRLGYLLGTGFPFAGFLVARLVWSLTKR